MILPNANVLIYAFRPDANEHARYRNWLTGIVNGDAVYGLSPQVLASVVRISTHPRIWNRPSTVAEVLEYVDVLLGQPHCRRINPGPRHWEIYCRLCRDAGATGNLTQDAWLAALAIEHGCEWVTADGDFARFPGLRWSRL